MTKGASATPTGLSQAEPEVSALRASIPRALLTLAERCEKAEGPDRELDAQIWCALHSKEFPGPPYTVEIPHDRFKPNLGTFAQANKAGLYRQVYIDSAHPYTASLDAALTLVPESWTWLVTKSCEARLVEISGNGLIDSLAKTPTLALCAAALKARDSDALNPRGSTQEREG